MTIRTRQIYHSANGDRWLLAVDSDTDRVFVRHEPNLPSGGQIADIELGAFLIGAGSGPEKQELLRLIGTAGQGSESLGLAANAFLKKHGHSAFGRRTRLNSIGCVQWSGILLGRATPECYWHPRSSRLSSG